MTKPATLVGCERAKATPPLAVSPLIDVAGYPRVSCSAGGSKNACEASSRVFARSDRLEVGRPDTKRGPAEVVEIETLWNRPEGVLIGDSMNHEHLAVVVDFPVSTASGAALRQPAGICFKSPAPNAVDYRPSKRLPDGTLIYRQSEPISDVVRVAQPSSVLWPIATLDGALAFHAPSVMNGKVGV